MDLSFPSKSLCFLGAMLHSVSVGWILTSNSHVCVSTCILSRSYKKEGKKKNMHIIKWSSNASHCCLLLYCRGLYVSSSLHFSINPSISVGRKFALDVHLLSGFFSYLFASLEFMILMRTITFSPFNFYEFEFLNGIMTSIVIGPRISPCLVLNICFKIKFVKEKFSYTFDGLGSLLWIFF